MPLRVAIRHRTLYDYDRHVRLGPQLVRLTPASHSITRPVRYSMRVAPDPHFEHRQLDPFGNHVTRLVFPDPVDRFHVDVELVVDLAPVNPFDFFIEPTARDLPFAYDPGLVAGLAPYREPRSHGPLLERFVDEVRPTSASPEPRSTVDWLVDLNQRVEKRTEYVVRMEPGVQTPEETLALGRGSCRDTAWLVVEVLRHVGLAARFVSGYLVQLKPDVAPLTGPKGPSEDFTDLHAWAEVYVPGAGWIGLDATSGLLAAEGHIPLACSVDPSGAAPVSGGLEPCEVEFRHHMSVSRVLETPRVTRPYEPSEWRALDALGNEVDRALDVEDARLTMGGEPTYVSIDDRDSPEWTIAALGAHKRERAEDLFFRLGARFAPGGLLHFGQGKWYPGESLPRWALTCHFRKDRRPIWYDPSLVAREPDGATAEHARAFGEALAARLAMDPKHLLPGYEDVWYYLWRERRLPVNVDPLDSKVDWEEERARLARVFEQGLRSVVGYALPLRVDRAGDAIVFRTGDLFLRSETLFLVPGDSPMGYRLPLDSLPWVAPVDGELAGPPDPFGRFPPLPVPNGQLRTIVSDANGARPPALRERAPARFESATGTIRTVLCVEPRDGILHVFVPPVPDAASYVTLVGHVEAVARGLRQKVRIEGYPPPYDPQLESFSVTPDPGVIEVNVHPASHWADVVDHARTLHEAASESRLAPDKFALDGKHLGSGGGNHITLGGPSPADSPLLRRPDLLASLAGYFVDHPSLSYMFSGAFLGPTSQHPRVDEARHETVRELEIACAEVARLGARPPAWLTDRLFRHLLTDVTGNTHRTELSIDKLYSPDGPSGRRGIVELRAFEMQPHPEMGLVVQLLVRALVATFLREPYRTKGTRWGTSLHDRFLLPHFVRRDLHEVLEDLAKAGFPFRGAWFEPHFEHRFPRIGAIDADGVELELRSALEPWNVLGEEGTSSGTSRFVDSSLERIEVKIRGAIEGRHGVLVNGRAAPLHVTGTRGELVAGVRFRAWLPPSCLHPTIPVHAPLRFEVVDRRRARSLGGCVHHVTHPDGRSYERFPVNAEEAAGRRRARFVPFGHSHAELRIPEVVVDPETPFTLDLRTPGPAAEVLAPSDRQEPSRTFERRSRARIG